MLLTWLCRNCGVKLARMAVARNNPRVVALTAQAGEDIIEYDPEGNVIIRLLCEECLETVDLEEDSEIDFLRGPELH
jgi:hypothetical protein